MARSEVSADGTEFTVPAARHKSKRDFLVPLSEAAQAVQARVPVIGSKGLVFTTNGEAPISGFSKTKCAFDKAVLKSYARAASMPRHQSAGPTMISGVPHAH